MNSSSQSSQSRPARKLFLGLLFAFASIAGAPAWATAFSVDQSDLWWVPAESGWGIQLVQRGEVIFSTMFVYDPNGTPIWYTATMTPQVGTSTWSGDMYVTSGTWYLATPFVTPVGRRVVGTMTWQNTGGYGETGRLTYTVDGALVLKNVVRQIIAVDNYAGHYAATLSYGDCNGVHEVLQSDMRITQTGSSITMVWVDATANNTCTISGPLSQDGQFGKVVGGNMSCTVGGSGSADMSELSVNQRSITGRWTGLFSSPTCPVNGYFSATRRAS